MKLLLVITPLKMVRHNLIRTIYTTLGHPYRSNFIPKLLGVSNKSQWPSAYTLSKIQRIAPKYDVFIDFFNIYIYNTFIVNTDGKMYQSVSEELG